jgi:hypothetical protein
MNGILNKGGTYKMKMSRIAIRATVLVVTALLATLLPAIGLGQASQTSQKGSGKAPDFADFPAIDRFDGKPAPVKLLTPQARKYRSMLRDSAKDGVNFAGHYTVGQWGCGGGCVQFAIIDAKTGDVFFPPFYVSIVAGPEEKMDDIPEPLQFKPNSNLLIVTGARNEKGGGVYYYKWDNNRLSLISSTPLPKH